MQVADFTAYRIRIELLKPIRHASHSRIETESIVVRCRMTDGITGWGEGLPREYVTGETIDTAWDLLRHTDFAGQFAGYIHGLGESHARGQQFRLPSHREDGRECYGNSVRCAIELSLLDAACRVHEVPLSTVVALIPETLPIRKSSPRVRYGAAFTAMSPYSQIMRAIKLRLFRFHQAKVKTGVEGVNDMAQLRRLRQIVGANFDLRIDANEAWSCQTLNSKIKPLLPFGITCVEQPVPHEEIHGLAAFRGQIGVPLMLDESLCSQIDAQRAIDHRTCDLFNIRLSKCGGLVNSLKLSAMAQHAGLGYQLGCQVGETGILSAAGRQFAASIANIRYLEGSYDRFLVRERLTEEDVTFGWGGYAPALTGPGLGISVDEAALKRVTTGTEQFTVAG